MSSLSGDRPSWWTRHETWDAISGCNHYATVRLAIIRESEFNFGERIKGYDHIVDPKWYKNGDEEDYARLEHMTQWVEEQGMDAIAFDSSAMGKYREMANQVLFKKPEDAMLFKLTWL